MRLGIRSRTEDQDQPDALEAAQETALRLRGYSTSVDVPLVICQRCGCLISRQLETVHSATCAAHRTGRATSA